jgi:hypothetical protein
MLPYLILKHKNSNFMIERPQRKEHLALYFINLLFRLKFLTQLELFII